MTSISPISTRVVPSPVARPPVREVRKLADPVPRTYGASPQQAEQTAESRIATKYVYDQSNLAEADAARARAMSAAKSAGRHVTLGREPVPEPAPRPDEDDHRRASSSENGGRLDVTA